MKNTIVTLEPYGQASQALINAGWARTSEDGWRQHENGKEVSATQALRQIGFVGKAVFDCYATIPSDQCLNCFRPLGHLDEDPNGDQNPVCAKCRAEEAHDFDAEPGAVYDRAGRRVK